VPAGIFLGLGVGMLTVQVAPYLMIGLGFVGIYLFRKK